MNVQFSQSEVDKIFWDLMDDIALFDMEVSKLYKNSSSFTMSGRSKLNLTFIDRVYEGITLRFKSKLEKVISLSIDAERKSVFITMVMLECIIVRAYKLFIILSRDTDSTNYYKLTKEILAASEGLYTTGSGGIQTDIESNFKGLNMYQAISKLNSIRDFIVSSCIEEYQYKRFSKDSGNPYNREFHISIVKQK